VPGSIESISITYNGRLASLKTDLIRNAAIAGVLHGADGVNRINAVSAAAERGIRIQEDKREHIAGGTGATLRLSLHWTRKGITGADAQGDWTGLATVLHGHSPRLLNYDGIDVEAELAGTLIVIRNQDVPGVIGRIGTIIGDHGLNIANFALGRATTDSARSVHSQRVPQGQALAVVQIDVPNAAAAAPAIEALRKVEAIASVRLIELGKL
jgi:D-3-phosphoglycerate dehydrogenase